MLMKRCVLIGFHISTSFPVKKLVWLEENRMAQTERDFSEDEFSAVSIDNVPCTLFASCWRTGT